MTYSSIPELKACGQETARICYRSSVAIALRKENAIERVSSGSLVEISGRRLVFTCAHFLNDHYKDDLVLVATEKPVPPQPWIKQIAFCPDCSTIDPVSSDIGIVEILPSLDLTNCSFITKESMEFCIDRVKIDDLLLMGSPLEEVRTQNGAHHAVRAISFTTTWGNESKGLPLHFRHGEDLLAIIPDLDFAVSSSDEVRIPDLDGMSGGGIWRLGSVESEARGLWSPDDIKFAGVMVEKESIFRGVNVTGASVKHLLQLEEATRSIELCQQEALDIRLPDGRRIRLFSP